MLDKLKRAFSRSGADSDAEDYLEIDLDKEEKTNKVLVKLFTIKKYEDVNAILNALREGYSIVVVDIKILRQKDPIELKRAVSKIKKTTDALEGTIAGFGENLLIATPSFAKIEKDIPAPEERKKNKFE